MPKPYTLLSLPLLKLACVQALKLISDPCNGVTCGLDEKCFQLNEFDFECRNFCNELNGSVAKQHCDVSREMCHYNATIDWVWCECQPGFSKKHDGQVCQKIEELFSKEELQRALDETREVKVISVGDDSDGHEATKTTRADVKVQLTYRNHVWLIQTKSTAEPRSLALFWATTQKSDSYTLTISENFAVSLRPYSFDAKIEHDFHFYTDPEEIDVESIAHIKSKHLDDWRLNFIIENYSHFEVEALWVDFEGKLSPYSGVFTDSRDSKVFHSEL